jgi:uncharacterized protein YjiS (DUF1127 family)
MKVRNWSMSIRTVMAGSAGRLVLDSANISRTLIGQIKNIRFTYQSTFANVSRPKQPKGCPGPRGAKPAAALCCLCGPAPKTKETNRKSTAMTALTISAVPSRFAHLCATIGAVAVRVARRMAEAWRHRRDAAALAALDDHMLADLGLTRADLNDALCEPLWRDPTIVLARRHSERRRLRRNAAVALIGRQAAPSIVPGADTFTFPPGDPPARLTM